MVAPSGIDAKTRNRFFRPEKSILLLPRAIGLSMNYDHAYHAGNFADVLKHTVLALCLNHLTRKPKPFFVLDTHAGQGRFDLAGPEAEKTGEARGGIFRLLEAPDLPEALAPYLAQVRRLGMVEGTLRRYPGSPLLARALMRPGDRLVAAELHPVHGESLARLMRGDRDTRIEARDGYEALKALVPPPERRGLVLIDPPFERTDEFTALERAVTALVGRWRAGTCVIWYPIKDEPAVRRFHQTLKDRLDVPTLIAELWVRPRFPPLKLNGTGLVILNPPYPLHTALPEVLPWLAGVLAEPGGGDWRLDWLIEERMGPCPG